MTEGRWNFLPATAYHQRLLSGEPLRPPAGAGQKDRLPPGLERQLQRNGTLPPGLQRRVQPLPGVCTARLPRLRPDWVRVVLGGRLFCSTDAADC